MQLQQQQDITIQNLLGKYWEIHEELPFQTNEYFITKFAMLETLHLFYHNVLTIASAVKLLTAGLQTIALTTPAISQKLVKLLIITSDISIPYMHVQIPVKRTTNMDTATQTVLTAFPAIPKNRK